MARPPQPPPESAAQAALAASGREAKKPLRTAQVSCWRMMPNVIGGHVPAQARYPDARLRGMGSRNPIGVSGKPPGGICGTLVGYLSEVKDITSWALSVVAGFGRCRFRARLRVIVCPGASGRSGTIVQTVRSPAGPCGMMSHVLAGEQDYFGVIDGSDW